MNRQDKLITELERLVTRLKQDGDLLWSRTADWVDPGKVPSTGTRGGGLATATSEEVTADRAAARRASRLHAEVTSAEARMLRDAQWLNQIHAVVVRKPPATIQGRDMLQAQVAADGWCVPCWQGGEWTERPKDPKGNHLDRYACRSCADFKRSQGQYPTPELIEHKRTRRKNWTQDVIDKALGRKR